MPNRTRPDRSLPALFVVVALLAAIVPAAVAGTPRAVLQAADRADRVAAALAESVAQATAARGFDEDLAAARSNSPAVAAGRTQVAWVVRPAVETPAPKARAESPDAGPSGGGSSGGGSASYRGRNHVWIPSLGINRSVSGFSCSSSAYPGNRVYRWGCAGRNNVYLLGHAYSVFKPLHDAYVSGRLRVGMKAYYADGSGRVHAYKVIWWKLTRPTTAASWAWASLSRPSMTLQTCVGSQSQYRLMVRLVRVG